jgi:DNA-binding transcriptional ArsR family regulator
MVDRLSQAFSALSDPTRRAILARLASGDASVNELLEPFDLSQPAISKHIKVLESAGLISRSRVAQKRPCHLEPEPLKQVADWLDHYRHLWTERFERLEAYLRHMQAESEKGK